MKKVSGTGFGRDENRNLGWLCSPAAARRSRHFAPKSRHFARGGKMGSCEQHSTRRDTRVSIVTRLARYHLTQMPSRSHLSAYVPNFELEESSSALEGFPNSRVSLTTYTRNVQVKPAAELSRPLKRRRTAGLNSRYDNMIEQVNMMYRSPAGVPKPRRKRASSSGSSSVSTRDVPQTPLDAYSRLQEGRLGKDFAVIKLSEPTREHRDDTALFHDVVPESVSVCTSSYQNWRI
ncbi:hypothetical protein DENSPDRAFT_129175 [Dentipellis sp. KUC8613]|nr:hypothetical protein DENSPDRAFT_129175 [Dentipellis sp. KUC8613]